MLIFFKIKTDTFQLHAINSGPGPKLQTENQDHASPKPIATVAFLYNCIAYRDQNIYTCSRTRLRFSLWIQGQGQDQDLGVIQRPVLASIPTQAVHHHDNSIPASCVRDVLVEPERASAALVWRLVAIDWRIVWHVTRANSDSVPVTRRKTVI